MRNTVKARIRIVRVLDTFGLCTEVDLANALLRLGDVDVINLSLGGFTLDDSAARGAAERPADAARGS